MVATVSCDGHVCVIQPKTKALAFEHRLAGIDSLPKFPSTIRMFQHYHKRHKINNPTPPTETPEDVVLEIVRFKTIRVCFLFFFFLYVPVF